METTILIETDPVLNYVNKRVLQLIGFKGEILLFSNGLEASAFLDKYFLELRRNPEKSDTTMIFVDNDLPDVDAMDLLAKVDELCLETRVKIVPVLMVAWGADDQCSSCKLQSGPLEIVTKPLIGSVLKKLIRKRLGKTIHCVKKGVIIKTKDFLRFGNN